MPRGVETTLSAGAHELEIQLQKSSGKPLEFYTAFVSPGNVSEPGPFFNYIDVMFLKPAGATV